MSALPESFSKSLYLAQRHWSGTRDAKGVLAATHKAFTFFALQRRRMAFHAISTDDMLAYVAWLQAQGSGPSTCRKRIASLAVVVRLAHDARPQLSKVAVLPKVTVRQPVAPRWWLTPEAHAELREWLDMVGRYELRTFVDWTCATGLRVEETLRVTRHHVFGLDGDRPTIIVPGTKTTSSSVTLPLSDAAAEIASAALGVHLSGHLIEASYRSLLADWQAARRFLGVTDIPTATLKSLRRSYAARLASRNVPTEVIRQAMRHSLITTTQGYLNLTGRSVESLRDQLNV